MVYVVTMLVLVVVVVYTVTMVVHVVVVYVGPSSFEVMFLSALEDLHKKTF